MKIFHRLYTRNFFMLFKFDLIPETLSMALNVFLTIKNLQVIYNTHTNKEGFVFCIKCKRIEYLLLTKTLSLSNKLDIFILYNNQKKRIVHYILIC